MNKYSKKQTLQYCPKCKDKRGHWKVLRTNTYICAKCGHKHQVRKK